MASADQPTGSPGPKAEADLAALRLLCECAYQATEDRIQVVLDHDWTGFPRVQAALAGIPRPVTLEGMAEAALDFCGAAVADLESSFPSREGHVSPLEVFRLHVLDRRPWPSIQAMFEEEGRPHARGTLIRRQRALLPFILDWAREGEFTAADPPPSSSSAAATWRWALGVALLAVVVAAALWWPAGHGADETAVASTDGYLVPDHLRGVRIPGYLASGDTLPSAYPPLRLPAVGGERLVALVIEDEPGAPRMLLSWNDVESPGPFFGLFDPQAGRMLWQTQFVPPAEERRTHTGVGAEVLTESYWTGNLFHAGPEGDLGTYVVATMTQKYSPAFVGFLDLELGEFVGHYVHPGHVNKGIVYDFDQDGRCEMVLGGQDNAVNRACLVALRPGPGTSAASTVMWNGPGHEGALRRVLLPAWPDAQVALHSPRLEVHQIVATDVDYASRILTVAAGSHGESVYHARLGPGLLPDPVAPLLLWDEDETNLGHLGIEVPDFDSWPDPFEVIDGREGI